MKQKEIIFIHPLKTGGTTVNSAMNDTAWQTKPDFHYRHIISGSLDSNAGDIFETHNQEKYRNYKLIMMLRNPVDRVISEYYFLRDKPAFMGLISNKPKDFRKFLGSKQTANGVINFLKGRRIYSRISVSGNDLDDVLDTIDELPIHVGIFEEFEKSLQYFSNVTDLTWKKEIEVKRVTFRRPDLTEVTEELEHLIKSKNEFDIELYNYCKVKFDEATIGVNPLKIKFKKDKYNHVIPYCSKWNLFEFCMENKKFLKSHFAYFKEFNFYLLNHLNIRDGREFTKIWNKSFVKAIMDAYPNSEISTLLSKDYNVIPDDPLEETYQIAKALDLFFESEKGETNKYYNPMVFKEDLVAKPDSKIGFLKKIFRL